MLFVASQKCQLKQRQTGLHKSLTKSLGIGPHGLCEARLAVGDAPIPYDDENSRLDLDDVPREGRQPWRIGSHVTHHDGGARGGLDHHVRHLGQASEDVCVWVEVQVVDQVVGLV